MGKILDIMGQRFGRLTVLRMAMRKLGPDGKMLPVEWECICDCGAELNVPAKLLLAGKKNSCGCLKQDINIAKIRVKKSLHLQEMEQERLWGPCPYPIGGCSRSKDGWCCDDCDSIYCKRRCQNVPEQCGCPKLKR